MLHRDVATRFKRTHLKYIYGGFAGYAFLISLIMFMVWFWVLNKSWCGFVCPLGTMQDWLTALRKS